MEDSSIFFLKLRTGEEVIAETYRKGDDFLVMKNPMMMEYAETDDGKKLIFMQRMSPFIKSQTVIIDRASVMFMNQVLTEVSTYYKSTVHFCEEIADDTFKKGMKLAAQWTGEMRQEEASNPVPELEIQEGLPPSSNTIH